MAQLHPIRIVLPWDTIVSGDGETLGALLSWRRPPEQLRCLRRRVDLTVGAPPGTAWHVSTEIRGFLRSRRFGAGFFLPLRSMALGAYAVAQLPEVTIVDAEALPAIGIRFSTADMVAVSHMLAQEALSLCALAGMTEDEALNHAWELEVELAARFNLD